MAKILIIDDDEGFCEALGIFLRMHGHEVITAMDGRAGLEAARQEPELIICDLAMPALGGQDVLIGRDGRALLRRPVGEGHLLV